LQPAEHLLFCKKCALQLKGVSSPQAQAGEGAGVNQNLPWIGWDKCAKFGKDQCRGLDFQ